MHSRPTQNHTEATASPSVTAGEHGRNEVILRFDPHDTCLNVIRDNELIRHWMLNYSQAKTVSTRQTGGFDALLEPHHTLTITGTEDDQKTSERGREDVIDFFASIDRPCRYVLDWSWTYGKLAPHENRRNIDAYLDRVEWLYDKRAEHGLDHVEFIPTAKGLHGGHYQRAVATFRRLDIDRIAIYVAQTPEMATLRGRIGQAIEVLDPAGVLVIGRQAPATVASLPRRVDGVAGYWNWTRACDASVDGYDPGGLFEWYYEVKDALQDGPQHRQIGFDTVLRRAEVADG